MTHSGVRLGRSSASGVAAASMLSLAACLGCGSEGALELDSAPVPLPGYPEMTSRLSVSLGGLEQKLCHATLVHPAWALTAAHCFSDAAVDARGALKEFERAFDSARVEFHPQAHTSGATRRDAVWRAAEFAAAHDLALVPIDPPLEQRAPALSWVPLPACQLDFGAGITAELGLRSPDDRPQTAPSTIDGWVAASVLLGPSHAGELLAGRGASIGAGDSGSGAVATWDELAPRASDCDIDAAGAVPTIDSRVILGVVQNANPSTSSAPFGLVSLHDVAHARWLAAVISTTPEPAAPPPPVLGGVPPME